MLGATSWIAATLTGTLATSLAIIAVASIGYRLLTGQADVRRGVVIIVGCFIIFGAPTIALGIRSALSAEQRPSRRIAEVPPPAVPPLNQLGVSDDPYASAAGPVR